MGIDGISRWGPILPLLVIRRHRQELVSGDHGRGFLLDQFQLDAGRVMGIDLPGDVAAHEVQFLEDPLLAF